MSASGAEPVRAITMRDLFQRIDDMRPEFSEFVDAPTLLAIVGEAWSEHGYGRYEVLTRAGLAELVEHIEADILALLDGGEQ